MLDALALVHASHHLPRVPAAQHNRFESPDDKVVQQHPADHQDDEPNIKSSYPSHHDAAGVAGAGPIHVDFGGYKVGGCTDMALSTGLDEVSRVDARLRIA